MRKLISLLLCMVSLVSICSIASAETISKTLTSTSTYVNALYDGGVAEKKESFTKWNAPFYGASDSQRVVVRIFQKGNTDSAVSSTWVYSAYSTTSHPYKTSYQYAGMNVFIGAKVDDRDEGPITISGSFNPNRN